MAIDLTLSIAARALTVDQAALGVIGNNIANVNTPGYSRQVPVLSAASEQGGGTFHLDGGVLLQSVQQILDPFVAQRLLAATTDAAQKNAVATQLTALVAQLDDLGDSSLTTLLGNFFASAPQTRSRTSSIAAARSSPSSSSTPTTRSSATRRRRTTISPRSLSSTPTSPARRPRAGRPTGFATSAGRCSPTSRRRSGSRRRRTPRRAR